MRYGADRQTLYTDIGEQIMLARRRAKLSQRALGNLLGISHAAVSDIERAVSRPNLDNLAIIAETLNVPLSQIVVLDSSRRTTQQGAREGVTDGN